MSISANFPNVRPSLLLDFANSQQLDPRVTFSRSTTAPYYGNTSVLAEQNLVLYSQLIGGTGWTLQNATASTNNATAPDGTTTATTLTASVGLAFHDTNQTFGAVAANTLYTQSYYLKAGTSNFASITINQSASSTVYCVITINLSTGAITQTVNGLFLSVSSSSISSIGSGYYRVSLIFTSTTAIASTVTILSLNSSATPTIGNYGLETWTALGTETIIAWGGQLEQRSTATAYNATTTTAITNYIPQLLTAPINAPRFDFNPTTGESLGLLIEQSSTNLFNYSEQFNNVYWNAGNSTVSANQIIAPDGNQTGDLWTCTAGSARHYFIAGTTTTGSYSCSVYLKKGTNQYFQIAGSSAGFYANFDLGLGVVGTTGGANILSSSITLVGNSWYRCVVNFTAASDAIWLLQVNSASAANLQSFTATGYETMFIWGAQLEALAFPTSYIPTTSAQVTRASDNASMTGTNFSSWYNQGQGTVYAEYNSSKNSANSYGVFVISDNSPANRYIIANNIGGTKSEFYEVVATTGYTITLAATTTASSFNKTAVSFVGTTISGSYNGSFVTGTSATMSATMTVLGLGYFYPGSPESNILNGHIKKLSYYGSALTSAQLQALTGS